MPSLLRLRWCGAVSMGCEVLMRGAVYMVRRRRREKIYIVSHFLLPARLRVTIVALWSLSRLTTYSRIYWVLNNATGGCFDRFVGISSGPMGLAGLAIVPLPGVIVAARRMKPWHCGIITVEEVMLMTCAEALASLRARPARPVQERILAAFSLWKFMEAGGTAEVLEQDGAPLFFDGQLYAVNRLLSEAPMPAKVRHLQVLHRCCHHALGNCMAAVDDRGAAWLQLGFGEGLLHALSCLPVDQAEMRENMAATLAHMSRSVANARLLRRRHSAQVAELLTALSHPRARGTRGQTLMLLLAALTRVLWVAEPDAELWGRLRDLPVCAGLPQFLDVATLDPVTPEVAPPTQQYVVSMQTAAALTIVLVALSSGAAAESVRQPDTMSAALCQVQRWALQTLITERTVDTLNGVVGLLSVCLSDLVPHRRDLPSQIRMLPKVAAILCLGMTAADATDDDYEGQDVRAPFLAALQSVGLLMGGSRPAVAAAA